MSNSKATAVQVMGIIFMALGAIASIVIGSGMRDIGVVICGLLVSITTGILLLGFAELIENSAETVQLLQKMNKSLPNQRPESQTDLKVVMKKLEKEEKSQNKNTVIHSPKKQEKEPNEAKDYSTVLVDFDCPHCGETISVPRQVVTNRKTFPCPFCNKTIDYEI